MINPFKWIVEFFTPGPIPPFRKEPEFSSGLVRDMFYMDGGTRARLLAQFGDKEKARRIYLEISDIYIKMMND